MIPTFVFGWPSGQESGSFLAVDLGGTNLRVCLVTLQGSGKFEVTQTKYRLTEEQKQEEGQKLFDFCAECLDNFIENSFGSGEGKVGRKEGELLPLGFTVRCLLLRYARTLMVCHAVLVPLSSRSDRSR